MGSVVCYNRSQLCWKRLQGVERQGYRRHYSNQDRGRQTKTEAGQLVNVLSKPIVKAGFWGRSRNFPTWWESMETSISSLRKAATTVVCCKCSRVDSTKSDAYIIADRNFIAIVYSSKSLRLMDAHFGSFVLNLRVPGDCPQDQTKKNEVFRIRRHTRGGNE